MNAPCLVLLASVAGAQPMAKAPIAARPPVEIRGRIEKVTGGFREGMPALEVAEDSRVWKVWLGSLRYLLENDFNPKAGQRVTVKGFRPSEDAREIWAASVTLEDQRRTLRLRDDNGWPLWRGGPGPRGPAAGRQRRGPGKIR